MRDRATVIQELERYWLVTNVPREVVNEMRIELHQHLDAAESDGRSLKDVLGEDPAVFAEAWASAFRARSKRTATWKEVQSGEAELTKRTRRDLTLYGIGISAVVVAVADAAQGGSDVENEVWRWAWTIFGVFLAIGEIFTAGFFLLPFAIGAGAAAILAWVAAPVLAQWLVFFGVSLFALAYLRRFITLQDEAEQPRVGANRWVGTEGIVLEAIDPHSGAGMVRVATEEWRATSHQPIEINTKIVVTEVMGARFVVEPTE